MALIRDFFQQSTKVLTVAELKRQIRGMLVSQSRAETAERRAGRIPLAHVPFVMSNGVETSLTVNYRADA
jgi:hypothetical protein